jgi:hypothetical protein
MSNQSTDLPIGKRHLAQIIRRKMTQRVKPCGKIYSRKKKTFFD